MKLLGVISDTHIPSRAKKLPQKVFEIFRGVQLIIHAGDLVQYSVLEELGRIAPVLAVCGNMDEPNLKERLKEIESIRIYDLSIGVTHDLDVFHDVKKVGSLARENRFDVLIFGHTHQPCWGARDGVKLLNPGSATDPVPPFVRKPTVALAKVERKSVQVQFVEL